MRRGGDRTMDATDPATATATATATAEPAPASPEPDTRIAAIAAAVEAWWLDHFPGSAVARDTDAWNVAHAAMEDLKTRLTALAAAS